MVRHDGSFDLEFIREQRWIRAWQAPALLAVASKPPADLTREDALAAGLSAGPMMVLCTKSWTQVHVRAGEDEMASLFKLQTHPMMPEQAAANPGSAQRLTELLLSIVSDPRGLTDVQLASVWFSFVFIMGQRPELGVVTANGGIFDSAVAELSESDLC